MFAQQPLNCLHKPHTDSCMKSVAVQIPSQVMWLDSGRNPVKSSVEISQPFSLTRPRLHLPQIVSALKVPALNLITTHPPALSHHKHQPLIYIQSAGIADLATALTHLAFNTWSFMGYYTNNESVTSTATAQTKIAVSVFLGIAGGLSRTESSFANLDWLLAAGPP